MSEQQKIDKDEFAKNLISAFKTIDVGNVADNMLEAAAALNGEGESDINRGKTAEGIRKLKASLNVARLSLGFPHPYRAKAIKNTEEMAQAIAEIEARFHQNRN